MADLLDIAPSMAVETVAISDGQEITVHRLHGDNIASLASRFPNLVALMAGGDDIVPRLFSQLGAAIGPIIAAANGHPGNEKAEQIAGRLLLEDQCKLLAVIWRLTFPNGLAALFEAMASFTTGAAEEKPKTGKIRLRQSPSALPTSSDAASRPIMQ